MKQQQNTEQYRLDKWLWAARFFKTRSLAKEAIMSGKVHCQNERCKPSRAARIGEELTIRCGFDKRTIIVKILSDTRRSATEAQKLYEETTESLAQREQNALARKQGMLEIPTQGRPNKKQRRQIHQFRQQE